MDNLKKFVVNESKKRLPLHICIVLGSIITVSLGLCYSKIYGKIIDLTKDGQSVFFYGILAITILCINVILSYLYYTCLLKIESKNMAFVFRNVMIKNILEMDYRKFLQTSQDSYISKILNDTPMIAEYTNLYWYIVIANTLRGLITFSVLLWISTLLTAIFTGFLLCHYAVYVLSKKHIKKFSTDERTEGDKYLNTLTETLKNVRAAKIFKKHQYFIQKHNASGDLWRKSLNRSFLISEAVFTIENFIATLTPIVVLIAGTVLVQQELLTIGLIITFIAVMDGIYVPIDEIIRFLNNRLVSLAHYERIGDLLKSDLYSQNKNDCDFLKLESVELTINNTKIVRPITIEAQSGDFLCIVGPNGAGKTTLFNLITKIEKPSSGVISVPLKVSIEEQQATIHSCNLEELFFLEKFEQSSIYFELFGIYHIVNASTYSLSGGEKQRLSLARAFMYPSKLILLDEPTSFLDKEYLVALMTAIAEAQKEKRIIVTISHDADFSKLADKVVYIE